MIFDNSRRNILKILTGGAFSVFSGLYGTSKKLIKSGTIEKDNNSIISVTDLPISGPWPTVDPFLFCVHHNDTYPTAKSDLTPDASLFGRNIGNDFSNKDGWSMYHGEKVPGFPRHPHRGFETLTVVSEGIIDYT